MCAAAPALSHPRDGIPRSSDNSAAFGKFGIGSGGGRGEGWASAHEPAAQFINSLVFLAKSIESDNGCYVN
jgi:hypothetical protein